VVLFGPPAAQLVVATVFSCWAGFVIYATATCQIDDPIAMRFLVGTYVYAFGAFILSCFVTLPFLLWIVRTVTRVQPSAVMP